MMTDLKEFFAITAVHLVKYLLKIKEHGLCCIMTGDFNCDLTNPLSSSGY